jgi:L-amino acid N-acyltransferase YncA
MVDFKIRTATFGDEKAILAIFNHYAESSFAAYSEAPEGPAFFKRLWQIAAGYPFYVAENRDGKIVGFALLHAYYGIPVFKRAARITYFIMPEYTHQGLGKIFLDKLIQDARDMGIDNILASISSRNEQSLKFHIKNGFSECGRFKKVGKKWDQDFDEVWMQRLI